MTVGDIRRLRDEAAEAGHFAQVAICDVAIDEVRERWRFPVTTPDADEYFATVSKWTREEAVRECLRVLSNAPRTP